MIKPYKKLSQVYDYGWADFSVQYVDWINRLLAEQGIKNGRILDLACGTGILAIELAKQGHTVHGMDISPEMIEIARQKTAGHSNLSFEVEDMAKYSTVKKYDLVICSFDSINYLRSANQLRGMLSGVAGALKRNGLFVFDSNTKVLYRNHSNKTTKLSLNGQSIIQFCSYYSTQNEARTAFSFPDGTYEIHRQRPYDYDELSPVLTANGFETVQLSSWFDMLPYTPNTPKLFCVVKKTR